MDEKLLGIGIVFILASMLYIAGLFGQRACYLSESDDASVQGKGIWRYLFLSVRSFIGEILKI